MPDRACRLCGIGAGFRRPFGLAGRSAATPSKVQIDAWPVFRGDNGGTGIAGSALSGQLELVWKKSFTEGGFESSVAIVEGVVYAGCLDGYLYALDLATGEEKWKFFRELGFTAAPAVREGRVYIGDTDGVFHCLSAADGSPIWTFNTSATISAGATFYPDRVLITSEDGTLTCLGPDGKSIWQYRIENMLKCSPTVAGDRVLLAGCDGKLHVIGLDKGEALVQLDIKDATGNTPATAGTRAFFGTQGGKFFAVDWQDPQIAWTQTPTRNQPIQSSAAATNDLVIFGGHDRNVHALDHKTGEEKWTWGARSKVDGSPVVAGEVAYVGTDRGLLVGLNLSGGEAVWEYEAGGGFKSSPAVAEGKLVIGNDDGDLFCFGAAP